MPLPWEVDGEPVAEAPAAEAEPPAVAQAGEAADVAEVAGELLSDASDGTLVAVLALVVLLVWVLRKPRSGGPS